MFKNFLTSMAIMLIAFATDSSAQVIKPQVVEFDKPMSETVLPMTSKIDVRNNEIWWGFWDGNVDKGISSLGTGSGTVVPEEYNACVGITPEIGEGMTIEGIKFVLTGLDVIDKDNVKIWISTKLPDTPDDADVICQKVPADELTDRTIMKDRVNEVRFDKPYKIPDNTLVYVGYTFVVTSDSKTAGKYPLMVQKPESGVTDPNSVYVKFGTSDHVSWNSLASKNYGVLTEQVLLSGTFAENSADINESFDDIYVAVGGEAKIPYEITNRGTEGVSTMDLIFDVNGDIQNVHVDVAKLAGKLTGIGSVLKFTTSMEELNDPGVLNIKVTLDKINGVTNESKKNVCTGKVIIMSNSATKKVLVEEFTGLWCGACPMGYVGMERLKKEQGDDVVIIGLHKNDPMQCADYKQFMKEKTKNSYPNCHIDRTYMNVYPYSGSGKNGYAEGPSHFGLSNDVEALKNSVCIANLKASGVLDGDVLTAKAEANFIISGDVDCGIAYVITEDGMQDDSWIQSNYLGDYQGRGYEDEEPLFDMWINGEGKVSGVVFNDVAIAAKGVSEGVEGSVPASVTADVPVSYETEFNLSDYDLIQDRDKLSLVVFLLDNVSGKVINVDKIALSELTAIDGVETDENAVEVARYTIDGRMISAPESGINIVKMSDGTVKKVVVR